MAFTDDDLKQFEEWIDDPGFDCGTVEWNNADSARLKALLARLEAAEKKAELGWLNRVYIPKSSVGDHIALEKADDTWRKTAGK